MKHLIYTGIIVASMLLSACVKELPFEGEGGEVTVVNCLLTNDSIQELSLTKSVKITDPYFYQEIREAEISLSANGAIVGYFEWVSYGNWHLKYTPEGGTVYQLLVKLPDGQTLTASTTMPPTNRIDPSINSDRYPTRNFSQTTADYPCWIYVLRDADLPPDLMHPHPSAGASLADNLGTNHPLVDRFNKHDDMSDIEMEASMPFYEFYLRIEPSPAISDSIRFGIQAPYSFYSYIYFRTVSDEYDKYLKSSIQKMDLYKDPNDPVQMFDESRVYSNITNGAGIFGAYNETATYYNGNLFVVHNNKVLFYDKNTPPFFIF
jgi:hypothetical protein